MRYSLLGSMKNVMKDKGSGVIAAAVMETWKLRGGGVGAAPASCNEAGGSFASMYEAEAHSTRVLLQPDNSVLDDAIDVFAMAATEVRVEDIPMPAAFMLRRRHEYPTGSLAGEEEE